MILNFKKVSTELFSGENGHEFKQEKESKFF